MALLASILLALIIAWALARPHIETYADEQAPRDSSLEALLDQKSRCLQLLKDLELDYQTGKITDSDYSRMRVPLNAELGGLLTRIDGQ